VLGVASPFLVFVCLTGLITAVLSIVFGVVALVRKVGKGQAITGIVFSVVALLLSAVLVAWGLQLYEACGHLPPGRVDQCVSERIPWG